MRYASSCPRHRGLDVLALILVVWIIRQLGFRAALVA
jgi:hypothetical protein